MEPNPTTSTACSTRRLIGLSIPGYAGWYWLDLIAQAGAVNKVQDSYNIRSCFIGYSAYIEIYMVLEGLIGEMQAPSLLFAEQTIHHH
jgi:hypothetical protein